MPSVSGSGQDGSLSSDKENESSNWWSSVDLRELLKTIETATRRRYPGLAPYEAEEIAADAVMRVIRAADEGRIVVEGDPTGYLVVAARNLVIDRARNRKIMEHWSYSEEGSLESRQITSHSDDEIAAFIERNAAAVDIRRGLAAARKAGDSTAFRIVIFVLDEIDRLGRMPSSRQIGDSLGLSHTGVSKALKRFRSYISEDA